MEPAGQVVGHALIAIHLDPPVLDREAARTMAGHGRVSRAGAGTRLDLLLVAVAFGDPITGALPLGLPVEALFAARQRRAPIGEGS